MSPSPSDPLTPLDKTRYDILCGLMASPPQLAVDEAIFRCLLFSGSLDIRTTPVRRSLPSLAEAIGRDGKTTTAEDHNSQVQAGHRRLRAPDGLITAVRVNKGREGKGRGYAFHHTLVAGRLEGCKKAQTMNAYWASKRMAIQVSPLGPSLEQTWHHIWWCVDSNGERTLSQKGWVEALGLSRATALRRLRELAQLDVGITFEELPPEPPATGEIGRPPKQYRVTAKLPPKGKLPDGAKRHRARQEEEAEMLRELKATPQDDADAQYGWMDGPDGVMVRAPAVEEVLPEHMPDFDDAVQAPDVPSEAVVEVSAPEISTVEDVGEVVTGRDEAEPLEDGETPSATSDTEPKQTPKNKPNEEELRAEAIRLYRLLWHKDLVEQAVKLAEAQLKEGRKISLTRRINNFYRPVWELQEQYGNPGLIRHALEKTIDGPPLRHPRTNGWVGYLAVVCKNSEAGFKGGPPAVAGTNAAKAAQESIQTREQTMREQLREAYSLNKAGDSEAARALLADMLARADTLTELFGDDEHEDRVQRCKDALRLAFRQGESDFVGARFNKYSPINYLPEWGPEEAMQRAA